ncbi:MAG: hypothetical protein ACT4QF_20595 [Sporichthyaceae bacterium]
MNEARLIVAERRGNGPLSWGPPHLMMPNQSVTVGREGQIRLGVEPLDDHVSRHAVTVQFTPDGWAITVRSLNATLVHPWALPAWTARPTELLTDSRVALRILGAAENEHWVLLENDLPSEIASISHPAGGGVLTIRSGAVLPLTPRELEAVSLLFGDLLAWPPKVLARPRLLKQVARDLKLSEAGVKARLNGVVAKATSLGLSRQVGLTDPEYVYVLVRAGYLSLNQIRLSNIR